MKKACLLGLLQFMIPACIYAALLWNRLPWPANLIVSILLGISMTAAIGLFWKAVLRMQDLSLLKSSSTSQMPSRLDGKRVAVFGRIFPYGDPIYAPFSGAECVCCIWGIYYWRTSGSGKNRSSSRDYVARGQVLIPSYVRTPVEDVRLLGFPHLEGFDDSHYEEADAEGNFEAWQKGAEYLRNVSIEEKMNITDIGKAFSQVEELMTDSDGAVRVEYRTLEPGELSPNHYREEEYVPPGTEICLMGKWSANQRGIVPEKMGSGHEVVIRKGSAQQVSADLRSGIVARVVGGIILTAVSNGVVWFLLQKFPG